MKTLITGAKGFIGKNLRSHLERLDDLEILTFSSDQDDGDLVSLVAEADAIFHLAAVNRPTEDEAFQKHNVDLCSRLCELIKLQNRRIPLLFSSSIQADNHTAYGQSKKNAEAEFVELNRSTGNPVDIYRLPGVFGKWSRPNYNSVVATFCHNISRGMPIEVHDTNRTIELVYIDDVVENFLGWLARVRTFVEDNNTSLDRINHPIVSPQYRVRIGTLAEQITAISKIQETLNLQPVGTGFLRALYATYMSFIPTDRFSYAIEQKTDNRGRFVEVLKTENFGQVSFSSIPAGAVRGQHFHHSKSEKFLVVSGEAQFDFRNLDTNETHQIAVTSQIPEVVETAPGWAHSIQNTGEEELCVLIWANEVFDHENPDTYAAAV